jgi:5-methylcytosine-specific restriction endonuclease McrA
MPNRRTLKTHLWKRNSRCHWCGVKTLKDYATVDHVKSRPECQTHAEYIAKENKVLACYDCNQRRATEFNRANPNAKTAWVPSTR